MTDAPIQPDETPGDPWIPMDPDDTEEDAA